MVDRFTPSYEEGNKTQNITNKELAKTFLDEIEASKNNLTDLMTRTKEHLDFFDFEITEAKKTIDNILKSNNFNSVEEIKRLNTLTQLLSIQADKNPVAKGLLKIIYVIEAKDTDGYSYKEIMKRITNVLNDGNIPFITKKLFARWLKNNEFLCSNPFDKVKIENELTIKYPRYKWDSFETTYHPIEGLVATNMFQLAA